VLFDPGIWGWVKNQDPGSGIPNIGYVISEIAPDFGSATLYTNTSGNIWINFDDPDQNPSDSRFFWTSWILIRIRID
jgi:hypothetical protein